MRPSTLSSCLVLALALAAAPARAGETVWSAPPYEHNGVVVNAKSITLSGKGKLWFKLSVINNGEKPLVIDPNGLQVKLPDGRQVARVKGMFDSVGGKHGAVVLGPGVAGDINAEFMVGTPTKATLVFASATLGGAPAKLPDLVVKPAGGAWSAPAYSHNGVKIFVTDAKLDGEDFEIKMNVLNDGAEMLYIDRAQISARLPDGSAVPRKGGVFESKAPLSVGPHLSQEVECTFKKVGQPASLEIALDGLFAGAKKPKLPSLHVAP